MQAPVCCFTFYKEKNATTKFAFHDELAPRQGFHLQQETLRVSDNLAHCPRVTSSILQNSTLPTECFVPPTYPYHYKQPSFWDFGLLGCYAVQCVTTTHTAHSSSRAFSSYKHEGDWFVRNARMLNYQLHSVTSVKNNILSISAVET